MTFPYEADRQRRARRQLSAGVRRADGAAERARVRPDGGGARRAAPRVDLRLSAADGGAARRRWRSSSTRRLQRRRVSTGRSCCAACTSPAARRKARRSIGCWASIGRRFGVAPDAVAPAPGRGKAFFIERLLKDVVIGESGLAGVNRRLEMRNASGSLARYAARGPGRVAGLIALSVSYDSNRAYLTQVAGDVRAAAP